MCEVLRVTYHLSPVLCHVSHVTYKNIYIFLQIGEANQWRVCYQQGQSHLVLLDIAFVSVNLFGFFTVN